MRNLLSPSPLWLDGGLALVRVVTGYFMYYHGKEVFDEELMKGYLSWDSFKGFSSPAFMVYMGKASELVAGILLVLGLLTRFTSLLVIGTMAYVSFFVGHGKIWYEDQHPFMFVLMGFVFFFVGGGKYSLDNLIFKNKNRKRY